MPIELKMPALSPTMEAGTLAKWLVKVGDSVKSGDVMAEIETDKATMEFEAVDEGTIREIRVAAGTDAVKVGTVIAVLAEEGEDVAASTSTPAVQLPLTTAVATPTPATDAPPQVAAEQAAAAERGYGADPAADLPAAEPATTTADAPSAEPRLKISPLAKRLAAASGIDLATLTGTGPQGRIVKADVEAAASQRSTSAQVPAAMPVASSAATIDLTEASPTEPMPAPVISPPAKPVEVSASADFSIPHEVVKLSNIRKVIARRLTQSKQTVPHIYLTVDVRLDALLTLRGELNAALEARGIKLSVNDLIIKGLALALIEVPACNVSFAGETMLRFARADVSVAVSTPTGLITPIIVDAGAKSVSAISTEMKLLAEKARAGKLQPHEYQGGTASLSNMGMFGIKAFDAVINPPQAMILAIGAGEKRPYVVDDALAIATVMSVTGSFDHRAIDGSDGAHLMQAFKTLIENPLALVA